MDNDSGVVYVLENPAMPGFIKIGITKSPTELTTRLKNLYTTGVPFPFICVAAYTVPRYSAAEKMIHEAFAVHRVNKNREFFQMDAHRVRVILHHIGTQEITPHTIVGEVPEDTEATKEAIETAERKSNFTFTAAQIPHGELLTFVDDESINCQVISDKQVQYQGTAMSLSRAALAALALKGKNWPAVSGPKMWVYQGETLNERRTRLAQESEVS